MTTARSRLLAAGIEPAAVDAHLAAGRVIVDGVRTSDPDTPAPEGVDVGIGLDGVEEGR